MSSSTLWPSIYQVIKRHPTAVVASVALHGVLLVLLSLSLSSSEIPEQPKPQATTVKAVVVDAKKIDDELNRRKQVEQDKTQQALAKKKKIAEEKKRQAELKRKKEAEKKRQAELKRKKEAEKKSAAQKPSARRSSKLNVNARKSKSAWLHSR